MPTVIGSWVRCQREAPSRGTWPIYDGRAGRVVAQAATADEVGVVLVGKEKGQWVKRLAWFRPNELVEAERPSGAPQPPLLRLRDQT